jgi:hypothetical protein
LTKIEGEIVTDTITERPGRGSDMHVEFDISMPPVKTEQTRVTVRCGKSHVVLFKVGADHSKPRLVGGGDGDWLPDWDWRREYVDKDRDRRGFALPYRTMLSVAQEEVQRREKARLVHEAAEKINRGLEEVG